MSRETRWRWSSAGLQAVPRAASAPARVAMGPTASKVSSWKRAGSCGRSIARVFASRQASFCNCMQKVGTHVVQNLAEQGERLGVGHCAQLEFRNHFHGGVAAYLTRRKPSGARASRLHVGAETGGALAALAYIR